MIRARAALFLLLTALVAVGCGGEDESADEFRDGYNAAIMRLNDVNSSIQETGEELASKPGDEIAQEFDRIAETTAQTREDLSELEPPDRARFAFEELLAAIEEGVEDLRAVASAARTENRQQYEDATEALAASAEEISEAETELKDAVESD
jgi:serine phosphatase RsbU (regulator of sigma subunit)